MIFCVDIGGTSTKLAAMDDDGQLSPIDSLPTKPPAESFIQTLSDRIRGMIDKHGQPQGIGVAVAGFLDEARTKLLFNSNLTWLEGFPLRSILAERLQYPLELEVDSNAACWAEYRWGSGQEIDRFLCLTAGTGLGVGMTIKGELLRFAYGCMGDAGHIVVDPVGPECACGGHGCAEAIAGAGSIGLGESLREVIEKAHANDNRAAAKLNRAGRALGIMLASLANIFFPHRIALAGGLSAAGDRIMSPTERTFKTFVGPFAGNNVSLVLAKLGSEATLRGAARPFLASK